MTTISGVLALVLLMADPESPNTVPIERPPDLEMPAGAEASLLAAIARDRTPAVAIRLVQLELWVIALVFGPASKATAGGCRGSVATYGPNGDTPPVWELVPSSRKMSYVTLPSKTDDCSNPKSTPERITLGGEVSAATLSGILGAIKASPVAGSRIVSIMMEEEPLATVTVIGSDGESMDLQVVQRGTKWSVVSDE